MDKQERIAECEIQLKDANYILADLQIELNQVDGFDNAAKMTVLIQVEIKEQKAVIENWRKDLATARAMPDDTAQVSEAETFLLAETNKLDVPCTIYISMLGDAILRINSDYEGHAGDAQVIITDNKATVGSGLSWRIDPIEAIRFAKMIMVAGEIALKWQAHVKDNG